MMYSNASPFSSTPFGGVSSASGMYRQVGVETSVSSASPHDLVKLLLDAFFESVAQARGAIQSNNIPLKAKAISKAVAIVDEGLKSNLDLAHGGDLAANLSRLYEYVCFRLTQANLKNDLAALDECAMLITPIRDSWKQIASQTNNSTMRQEVAA
jgi:flagellar secretion chaperone FliS